MKKICAIFLLACIAFCTQAATNITTSTVSGHWTVAGSPYKIFNNVTVGAGQTLTIDPGVSVIFQGFYRIAVDGSLRAVGLASAPIIFDVQDTTGWHVDSVYAVCGGWRGVLFNPYTASTPDVSELSYCNFHHIKGGGGIPVWRSLHISYCNFSQNLAMEIALYGSLNPGIYEFDHNKLFDNITGGRHFIYMLNSKADWYLHDNEIYNNELRASGGLTYISGSRMLFSRNSIHHNAPSPTATTTTADLGILRITNSNVVGGLLAGRNKSMVVVSENRIYENISNNTAAVVCMNSVVDIYRNYVCNNQHTEVVFCNHGAGGGGLFLVGTGDYIGAHGDTGAVYSVRNNIIANNYSALYGGGISLYDAKALIANNTIVNNKAPRGGGLDFFMATNVTLCVKNNIISGNVTEGSAASTGSIHHSSIKQTNLKYDHNWVTHPLAEEIVVNPGSTYTLVSDVSTNKVGTSPGFVSPTLTANVGESAFAANFNLNSGSPCINGGTDSAVVPGSADYAGNNRIFGTVVDIGAYEYGSSLAGLYSAKAVDTMFKYCCSATLLQNPPVNSVTEIGKVNINIYPNPAANLFFIRTPKPLGTLKLQDVYGKTVVEKNVTSTLTSLDVQALPRGIYIATWDSGSEKVKEKVILE